MPRIIGSSPSQLQPTQADVDDTQPTQVPPELQSLTRDGTLDKSMQARLEKLYSSQQGAATALEDRNSVAVSKAEETARGELGEASRALTKAADALPPADRVDTPASALLEQRFSLPDPKALETDIGKAQKEVGKLEQDVAATRSALKGPSDTVAAFEKKYPDRTEWAAKLGKLEKDRDAADASGQFDRARDLEGVIGRMRSNVPQNPVEVQKYDAAKKAVTAGEAKLAQLEPKLDAARAGLDDKKTQLAELQPKVDLLDRQIAYAQASEDVAYKEKTVSRLSGMSNVVGYRERQVIDGAGKQMNQALDQLDQASTIAKSDNVQHIAQGLQRALKVQDAINDPYSKVTEKDVYMPRLNDNIARFQSSLDEVQGNVEQGVKACIKQFDDPGFQTAFSSLPRGEQQSMVDRFLEVAPHTKAGQEYFRDTMLPCLKGEANYNAIWKPGALGYGDEKRGLEATANILGKFEAGLATSKTGPTDARDAMVASLNLDMPKTEAVKKALELYGAVKEKKGEEEAEKAMKSALGKSDLGRLSDELKPIAAVVNGVSTASKTLELMREPSVKQALETGASWAELSEAVSKALDAKGVAPKLAGALKTVGKAAAPFELVKGIWELTGKDAPQERGDVVETTSKVFQTFAAGLTTAGLIADASVIGAPVGVVLHVSGAVVGLGGAVYDLVASDSDAQKWMKQYAEYDTRTAVRMPAAQEALVDPRPSQPRYVRP